MREFIVVMRKIPRLCQDYAKIMFIEASFIHIVNPVISFL